MLTTISRIVFLFLFLGFFLFSPHPVFAITVSFSNLPASVDLNQEVNLLVNLECSDCGDSYLRGAFYESGTDYFGVTQNNSGEWVGTSGDKTKYFKVASDEIVSATWSGQLKVKVEVGDSAFNGPKNYYFKVARYTQSGSATWSTESSIFINGPTSTPTPTEEPSPTETPIPTSTPTPKPPALTPTPKPTKTPTPTQTPTPAEEALLAEEATISAVPTAETEGEVLGAASSTPKDLSSLLSKVLIGAGGLVLFISLGFLFFPKIKGYNKKNGHQENQPGS